MKSKLNQNLKKAWFACSSILKNNFTFSDIKNIVGLAGIDRTQLTHLEQNPLNSNKISASKGQLINAIDKLIGELSSNELESFVSIVIEEILKQNEKLKGQLDEYLNRLHWQIDDNGKLIPLEILDLSELEQLHPSSHEDLKKASVKFKNGDLTGAIASACAAVDSVTNEIYKNHNLENPNSKTSFQERCKKSIETIGIVDDIKKELTNLGWEDENIKPLIKNLEGSLNQFALVMQKLRSKMSDVHGSKDVFKPLVFDSIKYSQILIRMITKNKKYCKSKENIEFEKFKF